MQPVSLNITRTELDSRFLSNSKENVIALTAFPFDYYESNWIPFLVHNEQGILSERSCFFQFETRHFFCSVSVKLNETHSNIYCIYIYMYFLGIYYIPKNTCIDIYKWYHSRISRRTIVLIVWMSKFKFHPYQIYLFKNVQTGNYW